MQQIKTISGTTSRNEMLERIEDSMIVAENKINVVISIDFTILFYLPVIKLLLINYNNIFKSRKIYDWNKFNIKRRVIIKTCDF